MRVYAALLEFLLNLVMNSTHVLPHLIICRRAWRTKQSRFTNNHGAHRQTLGLRVQVFPQKLTLLTLPTHIKADYGSIFEMLNNDSR